MRKALPAGRIVSWQGIWKDFYDGTLSADRKIDPFNLVVVHEEAPRELAEIHRCPELLDVLQQIYPDLALYMQRFLIKDRRSRSPVFLHHDFGYDLGWPEKTSVFIPLSPVGPENGGLLFYPGTHRLGYLGDVGEFDPAILSPDWPILSPTLEPGDVALMHECTWHGSSAHVQGPDRILVQATYQPASDPSSIALLRGEWRTDLRLSTVPGERLFKRSRSSRLRELQAEVNRIREMRS